MTVTEALQHLKSLSLFGYQPGLETTRQLAAAAGNPERRLRFIHVAGTNGKGSVCAFLESVYRATGLRVGLYTSPHLVRFGERIQINRVPMSDDELARGVAELRSLAASLPGVEPTFFEFTTVLALRRFAEAGVDLVVWETGLGGRLDATNIVTPLASVVTRIGLDHQAVLGPTVARIAAEKAGIIKPGIPVLTAAGDPDALAILEYKARELDAPFIAVGEPEAATLPGPVGLLGAHQRVNAALAAATVRLLRALIPVSDDALKSGLARAEWPGRLQVLRRGSQTLVLDGAHNPQGIGALAAALPDLVPGTRPTLIVGLLADKDWREMARLLAPLAGRILTVSVSSGRTVSAADLKAAFVASGLGRPVKAVDSLAEALRATAGDPAVVITGSLYLVGEALGLLDPASAPDPGERALNDWKPPSSP